MASVDPNPPLLFPTECEALLCDWGAAWERMTSGRQPTRPRSYQPIQRPRRNFLLCDLRLANSHKQASCHSSPLFQGEMQSLGSLRACAPQLSKDGLAPRMSRGSRQEGQLWAARFWVSSGATRRRISQRYGTLWTQNHGSSF